ncbi:MAG: CBS domain-containing protein [Planctomycetaceae bacterium]
MICPDCGHDNIEGMDSCDTCGQPLSGVDTKTNALESVLADQAVAALTPKQPLMVDVTTSIQSAVTQMAQHEIGCLLVSHENALVGILTERDILNKAQDLSQSVSELMTPQPDTVTVDDSIAYALHAMHLGGYRHIPVVDDQDVPVGIISVRDVLRFLCVNLNVLSTVD